jgi:HSP20 family protein
MSNQSFDPLRSINNLRESVSRFIEDGLSAVAGSQSLAVDVYENESSVVVKAGPLIGIDPEGIDVSVTADTLTIKGETKPDEEIAPESYLRRERKFGPFTRAVKIPRAIRADQAVADFKNCILTITLPKVENTDPKVINVRPATNE